MRNPALLTVVGVELALAAVAGVVGCVWPRPGLGADYVAIAAVKDVEPGPAGVGRFTWSCGRNEEGHLNSANIVVAPGIEGTAHHMHDYVGNLSTSAASTEASLATSATTCRNGDQSTYFWPVLRTGAEGTGPEQFGRHGVIHTPSAVTLTFYGNPAGPVVAIPRFLRAVTGDAQAFTNGGARARPAFTCGRAPDRRTAKYPICDRGDQLLRIYDFPSCWDGARLDSPDHRAHLSVPDRSGACPRGRFAIPRLRITVAYDLPAGPPYLIDSFEDQRHSPITDHALLVYLLPDELTAQVVECLNAGRTCS